MELNVILQKPRSILLLALAIALAVSQSAAADPALKTGSPLDLSGMPSVGGQNFQAAALPNRTFLVFSSNRKNADQTRQWGDMIGHRYGAKLAQWNQQSGQPILIVPVLDLSGMRFMPQSVVGGMVKMMGGGNDVLLDWKGVLSQKLGTPSDEAAVVVIGPDSRVQAIATGAYSPAAATALFAALDADAKQPAAEMPKSPG
jgi:hypothetical protein